MVNKNRDPARTFGKHVIEGGVLQLRQPYVRPTGFKETPQFPCAFASRTNKGGHRECTPEQIWIGDVFFVNFLKSNERV